MITSSQDMWLGSHSVSMTESRFSKRYRVCFLQASPDYNDDHKDSGLIRACEGNFFLYWKQYTHMNIILGLEVFLVFFLASCVHFLAVKTSHRRWRGGLLLSVTSTIFRKRISTRTPGFVLLNTAKARYGPPSWAFAQDKQRLRYFFHVRQWRPWGIWVYW